MPAGRTIDGIDEGRDVERQRYPSSSVAVAGLGGAGTARCRVSAGNQGLARPDPRMALRAGGILVLLARREGLLRGGTSCPTVALGRASCVRPSRVRLREPDSHGRG